MKEPFTGGQSNTQSIIPAPLTYHSEYDKQDYPVKLLISDYPNGNQAILLQTESSGVTEDFAVITVNFPDELLSPGQAYLDTNNMPGIEQFIEQHKLGKPNGRKKTSGFCTYPLYDFDLPRCMEHGVLENP